MHLNIFSQYVVFLSLTVHHNVFYHFIKEYEIISNLEICVNTFCTCTSISIGYIPRSGIFFYTKWYVLLEFLLSSWPLKRLYQYILQWESALSSHPASIAAHWSFSRTSGLSLIPLTNSLLFVLMMTLGVDPVFRYFISGLLCFRTGVHHDGAEKLESKGFSVGSFFA